MPIETSYITLGGAWLDLGIRILQRLAVEGNERSLFPSAYDVCTNLHRNLVPVPQYNPLWHPNLSRMCDAQAPRLYSPCRGPAPET